MLLPVRAELTVEIARAPEEVFSYLTDVSNLPQWQSGVSAATLEGEPPENEPVPGALIHESRRLLGRGHADAPGCAAALRTFLSNCALPERY